MSIKRENRDFILVVRMSDRRAVRVIQSDVVTRENVRELAKKMVEKLDEIILKYHYRLPEYDFMDARCESLRELSLQLPTVCGFEEIEIETVSL